MMGLPSRRMAKSTLLGCLMSKSASCSGETSDGFVESNPSTLMKGSTKWSLVLSSLRQKPRICVERVARSANSAARSSRVFIPIPQNGMAAEKRITRISDIVEHVYRL
jgi:hypothetical protein